MIKPTIGRVVWFHPDWPHTQPYAAMIVYVNSNTDINLIVFDPDGIPHAEINVILKQSEEQNIVGQYAEWMPYQVGQAKAALSAV